MPTPWPVGRSAFACPATRSTVYLTGPLPELVDQQHAANQTASYVAAHLDRVHPGVLAVAFRSFLAPLVDPGSRRLWPSPWPAR